MLTHLLAPVVPQCADHLHLPRRLPAGPDPRVAITFDDGPHPEGTPAMLDALAAHGARATFFLIGEQVERWPTLAQRIHSAGHEVALHGHRHRLQMRLSPTHLREDLRRGAAAVEDATGCRVSLHRPPYGIYSPPGLALVRGLGLRPLLWTTWGKDWRRLTTPGRIARRVLGDVTPGGVILLHDADFHSARHSHRRTAAALPMVLSGLRERGFATVLPICEA